MSASISGRRSGEDKATMGRQDSTAADGPFSPTGLKVLVVDDDPMCLKVVSAMLQRCNYQVETQSSGQDALALLRARQEEGVDQFDLVLSDVYMPDMDGFKLLEHVGLELELPVIMMSSNGDTNVVLRGVTHGAVDFLIKPVRIEELRNVWQHVVRRRSVQLSRGGEDSAADCDGDSRAHGTKRKGDLEMLRADHDGGSGNKKSRVVWSVEMHQQFVNAVNVLGIDKAVPKRILDLMNVEGLTRENVASHLQKYRLYLKRVQGVTGSGSRGGKGIGAGGMVFPSPSAGEPSTASADADAISALQQHHHHRVQQQHQQQAAAAATMGPGAGPVTMMGMAAPMPPSMAAWQQQTMAIQAAAAAAAAAGSMGNLPPRPPPFMPPPGAVMPPGYPLLPPPTVDQMGAAISAGYGATAVGHAMQYHGQYPGSMVPPSSCAPSFVSHASALASTHTNDHSNGNAAGGAGAGGGNTSGVSGSTEDAYGDAPQSLPPAGPSPAAIGPEDVDALLPNLACGGGGGPIAAPESELGDTLLPDISGLDGPKRRHDHDHATSFLDMFMMDGGDRN